MFSSNYLCSSYNEFFILAALVSIIHVASDLVFGLTLSDAGYRLNSVTNYYSSDIICSNECVLGIDTGVDHFQNFTYSRRAIYYYDITPFLPD